MFEVPVMVYISQDNLDIINLISDDYGVSQGRVINTMMRVGLDKFLRSTYNLRSNRRDYDPNNLDLYSQPAPGR